MNSLLLFHTLYTSRGDGLLPEFVALLERPPEITKAELDFAELIRRRAESPDEVPCAPQPRASAP